MRAIEVTRLAAPCSAAGAQAALDNAGIDFRPIDCVNWKESYPFRPDAAFRIAHTGDSIVLQFRVSEPTVRAAATADNGRVWEDSCVEFFMQIPGADGYFNMECNCAGTLLVAYGPDKNRRTHLPAEELLKVDRHATLGREPFGEKPAPEVWEVSLVLPSALFGADNLTGMKPRGNFYKCGDLLATPHFLSWNPVGTPAPDFHRPEFFGEICFQ